MSHNPRAVTAKALYENHYEHLLGNAGWQRIHPAIRQRFSGDQSALYTGSIDVTLSRAGFVFAQLCRLIGSPLAFYQGKNVPIEVEVSFDTRRQGFCWDRRYHFNQGLSRVSSTKCIVGKLGLVEVLSHGFGMQLRVSEDQQALVFTSVGYFWQFGKRRIKLPRWLAPGTTVVRQSAIDHERFCFELRLRHPIFGLLAHQCGDFS